MSTHTICFYGELTKIILELSSNTHLICPLLPHACHCILSCQRNLGGSAEMSTPIMSTPKMIIPELCQNVDSQNVYCAKMSIPKMSTFTKDK